MSVISQTLVMLIILAIVAVLVASPKSTAAINAVGSALASMALTIVGTAP